MATRSAVDATVTCIWERLPARRLINDIFAVDQAHHNAGNRAIPWDVGNRDSYGGSNHGSRLGRAVGINAQHGADNRHIVAHILRKKRADRTVYDT